MRVIAVASCKGGVGKTTLAGHLAVAAERAGVKPALVVDTDPQGTLTDWWDERTAQTPMFARAVPERLSAGLGRIHALGVALILVDTPPALEAAVTETIRIADLVVIPVRPSPHDLRAAGATVALAERLRKPFVFVLNGASPRSRLANEAIIALSQHGTVAPAIIHQRSAFAASMIDGRTVLELPGYEPAVREIAALWAYLDQRLAAQAGGHSAERPRSSDQQEKGTWAA